MKYAWLALMFLLPSTLPAQTIEVPAGTILPLQLDTGLKAEKLAPGKVIRAVVMQNVPGTSIHRGARVYGRVVSVTPSRIELAFDTLEVEGQRIPVKTNLRALASMMEVDYAQVPEGGADRALPPPDRTYQQIGGEQVYRGGGPVARGITTVGEPTPHGVLARLNSNPPCRAGIGENDKPQALWLFSTDACGLYGYDDLNIEHSGRTTPVGTIILASKSGKFNIRSGSGLLLRVQGS